MQEFMYAVVDLGGNQYIVKKDDVVVVDKIDQEEGTTYTSKNLVAAFEEKNQVKLGAPYLDWEVVFHIKEHKKWDKVRVFKFQQKERYQRNKWFRASQTVLVVEDVRLHGSK
jgi:large subunit ribosomal protein L21